jgi:hypothetical protein
MQLSLDVPGPKLARLEYGLSSAEHKALWKKWQKEGYDGIAVDIFGGAFGPTWPQRKRHTLDFLADFPGLRALEIRVSALKSLEPLTLVADSVEWLGLGVDPSDLSCKPIAGCTKLRWVKLGGLPKDLDSIGSLAGLEALGLYGFTLKMLDVVRPLRNLERLCINAGSLEDIQPVGELPKLKALELMLVRKLKDVSPVAGVNTLQYLALNTMKMITALPDCSHLKALRRVYLDTMNGINDLSGLTKAPNLEELIVVGSKIEAQVFDPIIAYPRLKRVTLGLASRNATRDVNAKLGPRAFNVFGTSFQTFALN